MDLRRRWAAIAKRGTLKLSQEEFARVAGVSCSTFKRFERGFPVLGNAMEAILRALGGGLELMAVTEANPRKVPRSRKPAREKPPKKAAAKPRPVPARKKAAKPRKSSASGSKSGRPASTSRRMAARSVRTQAGR